MIRNCVLAITCSLIASTATAQKSGEDIAVEQALEVYESVQSHKSLDTLAPHGCADRHSIDAVIDAFYGSISGPIGTSRDWDRFKPLFLEGAFLGRQNPNLESGISRYSLDEFIKNSDKAMVTRGFSETETGRVTNLYGEVANVASSYEIRFANHTSEVSPITGVNFLHLVRADNCWRISDLVWQTRVDMMPPVALAPEVRPSVPTNNTPD